MDWSLKDLEPNTRRIPSGKLSHNYGKSPFSMGKSTISTGPCSIAMLNYQRVEENTLLFNHLQMSPVDIWLCLFFRCADFSKGGKFEFCEPYPRIIPRTIPRIIPANHTPKNHDYECFFWDRLGLHGLTSFNGRDKPIDKCWPDPMIPGCLHIPSRHEW